MNPKGPLILVSLILAMTVGTAATLIVEAQPRHQREENSEEFQRLVGGLGFGPAVDLSGCVFTFDPRLGDHCSYDLAPIPGGADFCTHHTCSIFYYPPRNQLEGEAQSLKHGEVP